MLARFFLREQRVCPSVRPSVRLPVCLSHAGIVSKRRKLVMTSSPSGSPTISDAKFDHKIRKGSPRAGAANKGGVGKISSFLFLSLHISKTVADTAKVTIND